MTGPAEYVSYADQAMLLTLRGAGQEAVMQALWLYERPVDREGLLRLHRNLGQGLLGRRIELSPLPFGRHRWVAADGAPFAMAGERVAHTSLYDWADRQVDLPLDPVRGPSWRLSAAPAGDGGAVVSLVVSHCIADGAGTARALISAMAGGAPSRPYPRPGSRTATGATVSDLRRLGGDLPDIGRAIRTGGRALRPGHRGAGQGPTPAPTAVPSGAPSGTEAPPADDTRTVHLPTASLVCDLAVWDDRAAEVGGNRFARAAAVGAHLGTAFGREQGGTVMLLVPVSRRVEDDHDGNAVALAHVRVPTAGLDTDLTQLRAALRAGIAAARREPDPMMAMLPLVPFVPRRAIGALLNRALGFGDDLPVSVSNLGELPPEINCADGTPAELTLFRGVDRHVSTASLIRRRGVLSVFAGAIGGQWTLTTSGWQPGGATTPAELRRALARAATDLGVAGRVI